MKKSCTKELMVLMGLLALFAASPVLAQDPSENASQEQAEQETGDQGQAEMTPEESEESEESDSSLDAQMVTAHNVTLPDRVRVGGEALTLNGTGLREKFWVDVYVGALYLLQETNMAPEVIHGSGPSRVALHFVRDVSVEKMRSALNDGFDNNLDEAEIEAMSDQIEAFKALFDPPKEGDVIYIDYVPDRGTIVTYNDEERGVVEGEDFKRAVLGIFFGEEPADENLRDGMLGDD